MAVGIDVAGAIEDEAGELAGGFDVEAAHGLDGVVVLGADGEFGASALALVAEDAAIEADGVGGLDVDAGAIEGTDGVPVKRKEAFDDQVAMGLKANGFRFSGMAGEIVDGVIDGLASAKAGKIVKQQVIVDGSGFIKVDMRTFVEGQVVERAVVGIDGEDRGLEAIGEPGSERSFTGAGWPGNGDDVKRRGHGFRLRLALWGKMCPTI